MSSSDRKKIAALWQHLDKKPLPVLCKTLTKVKENLQLAQLNYEHISQVIQFDPMFTFNYIAHTQVKKNQLNGGSEQKLLTPKHASMLLGFDQINHYIGKISSLEKYPNKAIATKLESLAIRSLFCAFQARNIAEISRDKPVVQASIKASQMKKQAKKDMTKMVGEKNTDEIFFSALLMSLPEIIVWHLYPQQAQKYELLVYRQNMPQENAQLKVFGFTFKDLMLQSSASWPLPDLYIETIQSNTIHDAKKAVIIVYLANKLSRLVEFGWYRQPLFDFLGFVEEILPFNTQRLYREFCKTTLKMAMEIEHLYHQCLPLVYMILQPGDVPYYQVIPLPQPKKQAEKPEPVAASDKNRTKQPASTVSVANEIKLSSASNLPTLIQLTIKKLSQSVHFDLIYLLMLDKSQKQITIRIVEGEAGDSHLHQKIDMQKKNLFSVLLEKNQPIFVKQQDSEKYQHLLAEIQKTLPHTSFYAKGFHYRNKPIGIFYATHKTQNSEEGFKQFRMIMVEFEQMVSKLQ